MCSQQHKYMYVQHSLQWCQAQNVDLLKRQGFLWLLLLLRLLGVEYHVILSSGSLAVLKVVISCPPEHITDDP